LDSGFEKSLGITQRHHDTIAFVLEDPMEREWPKVGRLLLEDAETNKRKVAGLSLSMFRPMYARMAVAERERRDLLFGKIGLDRVVFQTNQDYVRPLLQFFQERARRFR